MHSANEMTSIAITATGITAIHLPITPATNMSGTNAMIVVPTEVITAGNTS